MKSDARHLLNKKKWRNQTSDGRLKTWRDRKTVTHGAIDARKILNSKRERKKRKNIVKDIFSKTVTTNTFTTPIVKREFASSSTAYNKHVEVSSDGNIWITSLSKESHSLKSNPQKIPVKMAITVSSKAKQIQKHFTRQPATSEVEDLEHVSIDDLLDMEALPPVAVLSKTASQNRPMLSRKSLAEQVLGMKNTMVADQMTSASMEESIRICVTNLSSSVSGEDIVELFGDVGPIKSADLVKPGTAFVEFYDDEDARKACSIYHNRLLDGQPMRCYIQMNSPPQRSMISQRLGRKINEEPNHSPVSAPRVSNSMSRFNPRNVKFTVKLT